MSSKVSKLTLPNSNEHIELPVYEGTLGPEVVDVSKLSEKGIFTYDPGFMSTAACVSKITYIDGKNGILLHHGYRIEELAEKSDFLEVCFLLLNGTTYNLYHIHEELFQLQ